MAFKRSAVPPSMVSKNVIGNARALPGHFETCRLSLNIYASSRYPAQWLGAGGELAVRDQAWLARHIELENS